MQKYYYDKQEAVLYKSSGPGSLEKYAGDCRWQAAEYKKLIAGLTEINEEEADKILKDIEGEEYDLVDGYVLNDFSGEVNL